MSVEIFTPTPYINKWQMSLCNNSSDNKSYWIHRVDVKVSAQVTTVTYTHQSQPSLHSQFDGAPRTLTWQSLDLVQCHLQAVILLVNFYLFLITINQVNKTYAFKLQCWFNKNKLFEYLQNTSKGIWLKQMWSSSYMLGLGRRNWLHATRLILEVLNTGWDLSVRYGLVYHWNGFCSLPLICLHYYLCR